MPATICPRCKESHSIKSGIVKNRQRYHCKNCNYFYTVFKEGKKTDPYYVIKALQLHLEGLSLREIERLLGVSHVSVRNWILNYRLKIPVPPEYRPSYKVVSHQELLELLKDRDKLRNAGYLITELGDKFMLITWDRFRK